MYIYVPKTGYYRTKGFFGPCLCRAPDRRQFFVNDLFYHSNFQRKNKSFYGV